MALKQKKTFTWNIAAGCDVKAVASMKYKFLKPGKPMGEAWFLGNNRKMFEELMIAPQRLTHQMLDVPLMEIVSGVNSFGYLDEWSDWFHYLLAHMLPRIHEDNDAELFDKLISAFFAHYPNGIQSEPYSGFSDDILSTLARCSMDQACWCGDGRVNTQAALWRNGGQFIDDASYTEGNGYLASSMFFCLKYLPAKEIAAWVESILNIECSRWRALIIAWLVGAHAMLTGQCKQPKKLGSERPPVGWCYSYFLGGNCSGKNMSEALDVVQDFLPEQSRNEFMRCIRRQLTPKMYEIWMLSICEDQNIDAGILDVSNDFEKLYFPP